MSLEFVAMLLFSFTINSADHSLNNTLFIKSISCGTIQSKTLLNKPHIYSFIASGDQQITFSLCDSAYSMMFMSRIDLYDNNYQHKIQCSPTIYPENKQTESITATCNECLGSSSESSMTLKGLNSGMLYHIKISNLISSFIAGEQFEYPVYTLEMHCKHPTTTFAPKNSKDAKTTRVVSDDNVTDDSTKQTPIVIIAMIILFVVTFLSCSYKIYVNNKTNSNHANESDEQSDVDTLPVENTPEPCAPEIDEKVSLIVIDIYDDMKEGFEGNVDPGAAFDIDQEGANIDYLYTDIKRFFYNKVNIDGYNDIYMQLFIDNGFGRLDVFKTLTEDNLKDIGIETFDHRQKIMNEISKITDLVYTMN